MTFDFHANGWIALEPFRVPSQRSSRVAAQIVTIEIEKHVLQWARGRRNRRFSFLELLQARRGGIGLFGITALAFSGFLIRA
jgi:hypothetical protein